MIKEPWFGIGEMQVYYDCKECGKRQILFEKKVLYLFRKMFSIPLTEQVK